MQAQPTFTGSPVQRYLPPQPGGKPAIAETFMPNCSKAYSWRPPPARNAAGSLSDGLALTPPCQRICEYELNAKVYTLTFLYCRISRLKLTNMRRGRTERHVACPRSPEIRDRYPMRLRNRSLASRSPQQHAFQAEFTISSSSPGYNPVEKAESRRNKHPE